MSENKEGKKEEQGNQSRSRQTAGTFVFVFVFVFTKDALTKGKIGYRKTTVCSYFSKDAVAILLLI